jgi:metallophosphoesterase (TIGR00282 family)
LRLLFIGDIVGNPGRKVLKKTLPLLIGEVKADFCVANGENSAAGMGITQSVAKELHECGVDLVTMGNHTWAKKDTFTFIDYDPKLIRPANFPDEVPGKGAALIKKNGLCAGVINLQGRVFMDSIDCPFRTANREIDYLRSFTNIIIIDFHAEATSEKCAMGWYLDGKVSCIIGTHTHVQTADERILPKGTAFISDVGMTGPCEGIIGMDKEKVLKKFLTGVPQRFEVAGGNVQLNAVLVEIDEVTGKSRAITRIKRLYENDAV